MDAYMHRIVKAHLESFVKSFGLEADQEAVQFEKFSMYCVLSSRFSATFDLDDVSTGPGDEGIDGSAVVIDEVVTPSVEDAEAIFALPRRNHDVDIMFVQAKRSENFDLGDFLKFKEGILRFATQTPYVATDEVLQETRKIERSSMSFSRKCQKCAMGSPRSRRASSLQASINGRPPLKRLLPIFVHNSTPSAFSMT